MTRRYPFLPLLVAAALAVPLVAWLAGALTPTRLAWWLVTLMAVWAIRAVTGAVRGYRAAARVIDREIAAIRAEQGRPR